MQILLISSRPNKKELHHNSPRPDFDSIRECEALSCLREAIVLEKRPLCFILPSAIACFLCDTEINELPQRNSVPTTSFSCVPPVSTMDIKTGHVEAAL